MSYQIITHSGKVHLDEVLASALVAVHLDELPASVSRIESRDAEAMICNQQYSENSWFIDCGMKFDPEHRMFDHHQSREMGSAALLVFENFFEHLKGTELHELIQLVSQVDTRGIVSLGEIDTAAEIIRFFGFGQSVLLRYFEEDPLAVLRIMVFGLKDKIDFLDARKKAAEWIDHQDHLEIHEIEDIKALAYRERPPEELISALRMETNSLIDSEGISVVYGFDKDNNAVRTLFRTNFGHEKLDFTQGEALSVHFCHAGGFFLKFVPTDNDEWKRIISRSTTVSS